MEERKTVLSVEHLSVKFTQYERGFHQIELPAIRDLSLTVKEGEMVAVVGSSGSGKSLLAHAVLGILPYNAVTGGRIDYDGMELTEKRIRALRGREIVLVPQSVSYLDPLMKAGASVRKGKKDSETRRKCREVLARYGLGKETEELYPFELSGGMTGAFSFSGDCRRGGGSPPDHPRSGTGFRGGRPDCCLLCGNQCGGGSGS